MFVLSFACLFAFIAQKTNNKKVSRLLVVFVILTLTIPAGLRHFSVGKDTWGYIRAIESASNYYNGELFYTYYDFGFQLLMIILINIVREPNFVVLIIALITNILIIKTLWQYKDKISFSISIFCYITMYYFQTYNIMRQWLAIAIIFFAFRYLIKEKYGWFSFWIIIATSIHLSAIICFSFIPIYIFVVKKTSLKYKVITSALTFIFLVFLYYAASALGLIYNIENKYQYYINGADFQNLNFGFYFILRIFVIVLALFLLYKNDYRSKDNIFVKIVIIFSFLGTLLTMLSYVYPYVGRIGTYAMIFEILLFSIICKTKSFNLLLKYSIILLGIYLFVSNLIISEQGQMPYKLFIN